MPSGRKAKIPRSDDPLGFGLKSIPVSLQRLWLIQQGNPYFEDDATEVRAKLGIPAGGFTDAASFVDWSATRWKRHGHEEILPFFLEVKGKRLQDKEAVARHFAKDLIWPMEEPGPPPPCCSQDPLQEAARALAHRYGIDEASAEPGFQGVEEDVGGYLLGNRWRKRQAVRGRGPIFEVVVVEAGRSAHTVQERYRRQEVGLASRGGAGGMIPFWHDWWKQDRAGASLQDIQVNADEQFGLEVEYDKRSIRHGIQEVERLMKPVKI